MGGEREGGELVFRVGFLFGSEDLQQWRRGWRSGRASSPRACTGTGRTGGGRLLLSARGIALDFGKRLFLLEGMVVVEAFSFGPFAGISRPFSLF